MQTGIQVYKCTCMLKMVSLYHMHAYLQIRATQMAAGVSYFESYYWCILYWIISTYSLYLTPIFWHSMAVQQVCFPHMANETSFLGNAVPLSRKIYWSGGLLMKRLQPIFLTHKHAKLLINMELSGTACIFSKSIHHLLKCKHFLL